MIPRVTVSRGKSLDKSMVRRILVRTTNWVGDVVMTLPALEAVRENFPESSITILARPWVAPIFENHPSVDRTIRFRKGGGAMAGLREMIRVIRLIRNERFDLSILFQNAFEAALLAYLGGIKNRIGYNTDARGFLLTHRVIRDAEVLKVHQVEYYLSILRAIGLHAESRDPLLYVTEKQIKKARDLMASNGIDKGDFILGLSPGAIFGGAKRWPPDRFAMIGNRAAERWGAKIMIFGSGKETDISNRLSIAMNHSPVNFCGRTSLSEAMGLIRECDLFVTNDSGLMHIAAALSVPTVAIFGSTDPVATGPRGAMTTIVKHNIECAPCLKPECPTDFRCMLSIKPEEVWSEMEVLREKTCRIHRQGRHD